MSDYGLEVYDADGKVIFNSLEDNWLVVETIDLPPNTNYNTVFKASSYPNVSTLKGVIFPKEFRYVKETGGLQSYGEVASAISNSRNTEVTVKSNSAEHSQYCMILGR